MNTTLIHSEQRPYKQHTVEQTGKNKYVSTLYWYVGPSTSDLTETSHTQKVKLYELLDKMTSNPNLPPPASYRQSATEMQTYTIVENTVDGRNYRIDNQMKLKLSDPDPRLNIQYQIERNSHAMVLVRMKPRECPHGITSEAAGLIDEDLPFFGFSPGTVMGFIEDALKYSAANKCHTYLEWTIKHVKAAHRNHSDDQLKAEALAEISAKLQAAN